MKVHLLIIFLENVFVKNVKMINEKMNGKRCLLVGLNISVGTEVLNFSSVLRQKVSAPPPPPHPLLPFTQRNGNGKLNGKHTHLRESSGHESLTPPSLPIRTGFYSNYVANLSTYL
jgi:hypothetical protein